MIPMTPIPPPRDPARAARHRGIVAGVGLLALAVLGGLLVANNDQDATRPAVTSTTKAAPATTGATVKPRPASAPVTEEEIQAVIQLLDPALRNPGDPDAVRDIAKKYLATAKNRAEIRGHIAKAASRTVPKQGSSAPTVPKQGFQVPSPGGVGFVGFPANRADRFNVIGIGTDVGGSTNSTRGNEVALRWRADHTGPISQITTYYIDRGYTGPNATCARYWVDSTGYSNYACGTGGIINLSVQADDGTANHFPSGTPLATVTWSNFLTNGCSTPGPYIGTTCTPDGTAYTITDRQSRVYKTLTFSSPYTVTAGTLYHLVWTNSHSDKENNFISFDWLGFRNKGGPKTAQDISALPRTDWAVGVKTGNDPDPLKCWDGADALPTAYGWDFSESSFWPAPPEAGGSCAAASHFETYSPPVGITWSDGHTLGSSYYETQGYYAAWYLCGGDPNGCYANTGTLQFNTTQVVRQVFTWPRTTTNTTLSGFANMGQPVSGTMELTVRNTSTNSVLAQCTASVAAYGQNPKTPNTGYGVNPNFPSCTLGSPVTINVGTPVAFEYRMASLSGATAGGGVYSSTAEGIDVPIQIDGVEEAFWTGNEIHDLGHAEWCPSGALSGCSSLGAGKRDIYYMVLTTETGGPTTTTTSTSTTTTTIPGVPALSSTGLCSPGRRYEAETDWTGVAGPGSSGPGYVSHTNPGTAYRFFDTPTTSATASITFRVYNPTGTTATRTVYWSPYPGGVPLQTATLTVAAGAGWQTTTAIPLGTLTAGQLYEFSPSWDPPGNSGALVFDYADICGSAFTATTTTTTTSTTTTSTTTTTTPPSQPCSLNTRRTTTSPTGTAMTDGSDATYYSMGVGNSAQFTIGSGTVTRAAVRFAANAAARSFNVQYWSGTTTAAGVWVNAPNGQVAFFKGNGVISCATIPLSYLGPLRLLRLQIVKKEGVTDPRVLEFVVGT